MDRATEHHVSPGVKLAARRANPSWLRAQRHLACPHALPPLTVATNRVNLVEFTMYGLRCRVFGRMWRCFLRVLDGPDVKLRADKEDREASVREAVTWVESNYHCNGRRRDQDERWIYFIRAVDGGPIKIGKATNLRDRLGGLQTSHHDELHVYAAIRGPAVLEKLLHQIFADHRKRGEWFFDAPALLAAVDTLDRADEEGHDMLAWVQRRYELSDARSGR